MLDKKSECTILSSNNEEVRATIIALETQAFELWNNGNPDGFIELSSDDVVYFDPALENQLVGKKALEDYYNNLWNFCNPIWTSSALLHKERTKTCASIFRIQHVGSYDFRVHCSANFRILAFLTASINYYLCK